MLTRFDRLPKKEVMFTRRNIYERDGYRCMYCGVKFRKEQLNFDHVIPRDKGGQTTWENIVCACIPCNTRKANRTPVQAGMTLVKKPVKPKWRATSSHLKHIAEQIDSLYKSDWIPYIDAAGWPVEVSGHEQK